MFIRTERYIRRQEKNESNSIRRLREAELASDCDTACSYCSGYCTQYFQFAGANNPFGWCDNL